MRAHFQKRVVSFPISRAWVNWGTNTGRDPSKGEKSGILSIKRVKKEKGKKAAIIPFDSLRKNFFSSSIFFFSFFY